MKITIKDIARMAGVSITTVSLVLNNRPSRISESKREEIKKLAEKYNYVPNISARSLVSKSSKIIGLIIPDLENAFFASLAKSIERECALNNYAIIIASTDDEVKNDISLIQKLINLGIDGLLITISRESYSHQDEIKKTLNDIKIPFVMVDRTFPDYDVNNIYFDNQLGGYLQTKYAIENGHKHIACLSTRNISNNGYYRFLGYKKALEEAHIPLNENYIYDGEYKYDSGYMGASSILDQKEITAVVAANDLMAYGFIQKAREKQIDIPNDILIVGYDNLAFNQMLGFNLVSIHQDVSELGKRAVGLLFEKIRKHTTPQTIVLKPKLNINI